MRFLPLSQPLARTTRIAAITLIAAFAAAAPADASTYILRPTSTVSGAQWTVTPTGATIDSVLSDDVVQPTAPDTSTGYITSPLSATFSAAVGVAAPALTQGENVTGATAWVYLDTGATRPATVYIYTSSAVLGYAAVRAGQSPGWVSVPSNSVPTATQAASLRVAVQPFDFDTSTPIHVYGAYVALQTEGAAPADGTSPSTTVPGTTDGTTPPTTAVTGDTGSTESPFAATLPNFTALAVRRNGAVRVPVSCPGLQLPGCTGTVTLSLTLRTATSAERALVTGARRRKLVLRSRAFKIAAGKTAQVPVRLNRRTERRFRPARQVRARVTVSTTLADGKRTETARTVTLRLRRTAGRTK